MIRIIPNLAKPVVVEKPVTEFFAYEAKKGDTFYSIARDNNVDVNVLIADYFEFCPRSVYNGVEAEDIW